MEKEGEKRRANQSRLAWRQKKSECKSQDNLKDAVSREKELKQNKK